MSEALNPVISKDITNKIIEDLFENSFETYFYELFSKKLGFIQLNKEVKIIIDDMLELLEDFGYDYTLFLRSIGILIDEKLVFNNDYLDKDNSIRKDFISTVYFYSLDHTKKLNTINSALPLEKLTNLQKLEESKIKKIFNKLYYKLNRW